MDFFLKGDVVLVGDGGNLLYFSDSDLQAEMYLSFKQHNATEIIIRDGNIENWNKWLRERKIQLPIASIKQIYVAR